MTQGKRYTDQELQQYLEDGIAMLKKENEELHKDKARLDWLADLDNSYGTVLLPTEIVEQNIHCMRSAIDAARALHKN